MTVHADCGDGAWVVHVAGILDTRTAPTLAARLASLVRLGALDVIVDLREIDAIDPAGIAILTGVARRAEWTGIGFATIVPAGDLGREIAELNVAARLQSFTDEQAARAHAAACSRRAPRATALRRDDMSRR